MNPQLTVEEINLICIYDTSSRGRLIFELTSAMDIFSDTELIEIAQNVHGKVSKMSDAEFDALELYPIFDKEAGVNG
jgi:hypothetical protein